MNNHTNIEFKKFLIYLIKTKKYDSLYSDNRESITLSYKNNDIYKHVIFNRTKNIIIDVRFYDKSNKETITIPVFKNIFYFFNIPNIKLNRVIINELKKNEQLNDLNTIYSQMTIEYKQLINK